MIVGSEGSDTIDGGTGDDVLIGASTGQAVYSLLTDEVNRIKGGSGNDRLIGGRGINTLMGDNGDLSTLFNPALLNPNAAIATGTVVPGGNGDSDPDLYIVDGNDVVVDNGAEIAILGSDNRLYVFINGAAPVPPTGNTEIYGNLNTLNLTLASPGQDLIVRLENIAFVHGSNNIAQGIAKAERAFRDLNTVSGFDWLLTFLQILESIDIKT